MPDSADPLLQSVLDAAFERLHARLPAALPRAAPALEAYLEGAPTKPAHAFGPRAFPHLLLPYWLSPPDARARDAAFQIDLMYSSVIGYYAIRLCDNIADNDGPPELRKLSPCTLFFDSEATRAYMPHFAADHPFWPLFDRYAAAQAEASAADSLLSEIDAAAFAAISARKFSGAKIPAAAALLRYGAPETALSGWFDFIDALGGFAQLNNDFLDWRHDSEHGVVTYVSSQARGQDVTGWMLAEGFDWGVAELNSRFRNVKLRADSLGNAEVLAWVKKRELVLSENLATLRGALELMKTFAAIVLRREA